MKMLRNILTVIGLLIIVADHAKAQAPQPIGDIISYQGKLTNADGTPIANGVYNVAFRILRNGTPTSYSQTMAVRTLGGVFSAFLSIGALTFDPTKIYELGIKLLPSGTETKHAIASVPVAQVAVDNVKKTGDTMTGTLNMTGNQIHGVRSIYGPADNAKDGPDLALFSGTSGKLYLEYGATGKTVRIGDAGNVGLSVTGNVSIGGQITTPSVGTAAIQDNAVTRAKAPWTLSGNYNRFSVKTFVVTNDLTVSAADFGFGIGHLFAQATGGGGQTVSITENAGQWTLHLRDVNGNPITGGVFCLAFGSY